METGEVVQKYDVPDVFGEGIVNWKDRLIEVTWQAQAGFVYDLTTFGKRSEFHYSGEGWGLTQDGRRIIMSDGITPRLRFFDPESLRETGSVTVTADGAPVLNLNELEWVKGEVYANIWHSDRIARIDPVSGKVAGWIECAGLLRPSEQADSESVLNGIAYDAEHNRLFVTGKQWPKLFEIKLVKR